MSLDQEGLYNLLLMAVPLLLSLTIHEAAHATTANAFGDPTAKNLGRCSLNPLVHLDFFGTICMLFGGFGWAKPVPVNPYNLHPPKLGNIMVSLAGPLSNIVLALLCALALRGVLAWQGVEFYYTAVGGAIWTMLGATMGINVSLAIFNMLPLFPLDGHHILREQLPADKQDEFMRWQMQYGMWVLMAIIFLPNLAPVIGAPSFSPIGYVSGHAEFMLMKHVVGLNI